AYEGGFAVGILRDAEGGSVASVATVGLDGQGSLVRLARARADIDAPVVVGSEADLVAGYIEPNASGRTLKLAKLAGGRDVIWGAELAQGRDESLSFDLAAGPDRVIATWDDVGRGRDRSSVFVAVLDAKKLAAVEPSRAVTAPALDADMPRLASRAG